MYRTASHLLNGNGGNILVVTILILFGVSVIGTTLAMISSTDLKISGNQRTHTTALYIAEAGLNEVLHRVALSDPTDATVGGWTGNAAIRDPNDPVDPNWEARVYLTSPANAPAGGGSVVTTGTLQNPGNPYMQYSA
ncbi:MAG: pilus assembly PilX N-terminal domain-containing protein, partial [Candidatus Krumholzibacteria bacterium]|nr:pilus assembly PilX N-terminal domain-containing protein [Candidatus Krumholzibacteria bacterium]